MWECKRLDVWEEKDVEGDEWEDGKDEKRTKPEETKEELKLITGKTMLLS